VFKVVSTEFSLMLLIPLLIIVTVFYLRGPCGTIEFDDRNDNQIFIRNGDLVSQLKKQCFLLGYQFTQHTELHTRQSPLKLEGTEEHTYAVDKQTDGSRVITDTAKSVGTPGNTVDYSETCDGLEQRPEGLLFKCKVHVLLSDPGTKSISNDDFQ
jgi:hypothetical protein